MKHKPWIVAVALVVSALLTKNLWLPRLTGPDRNFLYAIGPECYTGLRYEVEVGKLVDLSERTQICDSSNPFDGIGGVRLFVYDVRRNDSRRITFSEAKGFTLDYGHDPHQNNESKPSNGFRVVWPRDACGWGEVFCLRDDYSNVWLDGRSTSRKLGIPVSNPEREFSFLGWIVRE